MFNINTPKDNEGMKSELIQELNKDKSEPKEQLVRYKKGEIVKDLNGKAVTKKLVPSLPQIGYNDVPIKSVEGEPEYADEFIDELASEVWDSGKSIESVYNNMRKKYKGASALIDKDDATFNDKNIPEKQKKYKYYKHWEWEGPDGKEEYYLSPKDATEIALAKTYGLNLEYEGKPLAQIKYGTKPSTAAKIINSDKELKKNWETFLNNPRDFYVASHIVQAIQDLEKKNYKQYGFKSKNEYDRYVKYIKKSFFKMYNRAGEAEFDDEDKAKAKAEAKETKPVPVAIESTTNKNIEKIKVENKKEEEPETETEKDETATEDPLKKAEELEIKAEEPEKDETEDPLKKAEELEEELEQKKYQAPADIKRFSNDLNRFVIQAYLNGDFGKKKSPNAIATMGFFVLDKIGAALVNASEVARGMSPSAKSQWSKILDKQTDLLGSRITANWFNSLSKTEQEALIRSGVISGTTARTIYETVNTGAVDRAEQKDVLEINKLSQEQKGIAQSNINALLARKSELQTLITQLRSDQGWEVYAQAMNAVVGTAKGLSSLGVTDASSSSSNKGFSDTLSANVSTGSVTKAFVSGGISNNSSWNNSSAKALSKSNSLSQDALALSKFRSGESYANATREAKKAANEQLIKRLEGQIEIIDKCIDSWGKDLGL